MVKTLLQRKIGVFRYFNNTLVLLVDLLPEGQRILTKGDEEIEQL